MFITNDLVDMKLLKYRSLFEQWQQVMKEKYGTSVTIQDDQLMLCHALDDGIAQMRLLLKLNGENEAV